MLKAAAFSLNIITFILVIYGCKSDEWRVTIHPLSATDSTETREGIWWWCNYKSRENRRNCEKQPYNFEAVRNSDIHSRTTASDYEAPRFVMYQCLTIFTIVVAFVNTLLSFVALDCTTISVQKSSKSRISAIVSFITAILITIPTVYFTIADIFNYETQGKSRFGIALWAMYFSIVCQVTATVCSFMGKGSTEEDYEIGQTFDTNQNRKLDYTGGNDGNTYI